MNRLLVIGFFLYSGAVAAQTDDRQVRTVAIEEGQVRIAPADENPVRVPQAVRRSDQRRVRGPVRALPSDERRGGAEQPDQRLVLARRLVDLGGDGGGLADPAASCIPDTETMQQDIVAAYRANPADFHGISPQSAYWKDVELAWHDYYVDRCAAQNSESSAAIIARSYAESLSTDELRKLVAFQESPTGRAFIAATERARKEVERAQAAPAQSDTDDASARFRETMLRLRAKYERTPK